MLPPDQNVGRRLRLFRPTLQDKKVSLLRQMMSASATIGEFFRSHVVMNADAANNTV